VDSYHFFGTPSYVLANKLKHLNLELKHWNKEVFGNVEDRKKSLFEEIQALDGLEHKRVKRAKAKTDLENVPLAGGRNLGQLGFPLPC